MSEWSLDDQLRMVADSIAARVSGDGDGRELDPATLALLIPVIKCLIQCLMRNDDVSASGVKNRVCDLYERNSNRLIRRTATSIKHEYRQRGETINNQRARELAVATINEAMESDSSIVETTCNALSQD